MHLLHFFVEGISHSSYLLGGDRGCAIIDPSRDTGIYTASAEKLGLRITHVLLTHLHADFVSGHLDLAAATGARILAPAKAGFGFDHVPVSEGDNIRIDQLRLSVLETPGHTPEHVSFVVTDSSRSEEPAAVFSGDTLFVGDTGRPDIFPSRAAELAAELFESIHGKLLVLPDHCMLYPAHGAGSLCGRSIKTMSSSTIGYERRSNPTLSLEAPAFVRALTTDMPPVPDHFLRCGAINAEGPVLLSDLPAPMPMSPDEFSARIESGAIVIDSRSYDSFGGMHVPGALSIDLDGNFSTMSGWVVPPGREILLVPGKASRAAEAVTALRRVGLDGATGYLDGGMFAWARAGHPVDRVYQVSPCELSAVLESGEGWNLIDVRSPAEFQAGRLAMARNIPVADLRTRSAELRQTIPTLVMCGSGRRSSLAASILLRNGLRSVFNLAGGLPAAVKCMKSLDGVIEGDPRTLVSGR